MIRFGRPKPTHEVRPSEIHELRLEILKIQNESKLKQTQLNRLKERIIEKTEAINRTVKQKNGNDTGPSPGATIAQVQRSIEAAEHAFEKVQLELKDAQYDDRTALYQEVEEELRATYLEYERLQQEVIAAREEAHSYDAQLKEVDYKASAQNAEDLNRSLAQLKGFNHALRDKWKAYHLKMEKMRIEQRISDNRKAKRHPQETVDAAAAEYDQEVEKLNSVADELDQVDAEYRQNAARLMEIIDDQRRAIVRYLMGNDNPEEDQ
jgi:chromosome segregation ATPase